MYNLRSSQSTGMETAWLDRSHGITTCCCRRYVAGRDILLEEICYWRGYVTGGDMLLEGILKGSI